MIYKARTKSTELLTLEFLNERQYLSEKDKQYYFNLSKGFDGEVLFDSMTEKLQCECLILNDLLLRVNNTTFQIDSLIIMPDFVRLFEVKNHEGDFYYEADKIYIKPKTEVLNPIHQLNRSETLLRQLFLQLGYTFQIDASIVFINSEFTLYQAPLHKPFILPTQISRYLNKLDTSSGHLTKKHELLAEKLVSLHMIDSPFSQLPKYDYSSLKKGNACVNCHSFSIHVDGPIYICKECGCEEPVDAAILRSVREYTLLFPNRKVTTTAIHEWCGGGGSMKVIRRVLNEHFNFVWHSRWSYYEI